MLQIAQQLSGINSVSISEKEMYLVFQKLPTPDASCGLRLVLG